MIAANASQAFANAAAAMVGPHDIAGTLTSLLNDCRSLTGAAELGIVVQAGRGSQELLAATSHAAAELELYQIQRDHGPCLETLRTGASLYVAGPDELVQRWGAVGTAMVAAGYVQVHTSPMRWQEETIGALNAFHRDERPVDDTTLDLCQAFANIATAVIIQSSDVSGPQLVAQINRALQGRIIIEQAKGVLAEKFDLDMAQAYAKLADWPVAEPGETLTVTANRILRLAEQGRL